MLQPTDYLGIAGKLRLLNKNPVLFAIAICSLTVSTMKTFVAASMIIARSFVRLIKNLLKSRESFMRQQPMHWQQKKHWKTFAI